MTKAIKPFFSKEREAYTGEGWVVGLVRDERTPPEDKFIRGHASFATKDEAEAFCVLTNWGPT